MRNLKKVLSLSLALVMLLGMMVVGASAATALDVYPDADTITYKEAVDLLTALDVLEGDNGGFRPTDTLTREEAAKIVAYTALGVDAAEALSVTKAPFTDVSATRWSAGYIAYCANVGIINGMGDGTFRPTDEVTGYQMAKMLLCVVGYGVNDEYTGSNWSLNVAKDGVTTGMFNRLSNVGNTPATREEAAQLAFNAITKVQMVAYSTLYGTYSAYTTAYGSQELLGLKVEKIFNAASADTTDDYGYNYHHWHYVGSKAAITDSYLTDNILGTVTSGTAGALEKAYDLDERIEVWENGVQVTVNNYYLGAFNMGTDHDTDYVNGEVAHYGYAVNMKGSNASIVPYAGQTITVVDQDGDGDADKLIVVTSYLAEVTKVNAATASADRSVNVTVYAPTADGKTFTTSFETEDYEKGDMILVDPVVLLAESTVANVNTVIEDNGAVLNNTAIIGSQAAEVVSSATVTAYYLNTGAKANGSVTTGGVKYNYNGVFAGYDEGEAALTAGSGPVAALGNEYTTSTNPYTLNNGSYNFYLDQNGNVIGVKVVENAIRDFAYITAVGEDAFQQMNIVNVVLSDGTTGTYTVTAKSTPVAYDNGTAGDDYCDRGEVYAYTLDGSNITLTDLTDLDVDGDNGGNTADAYSEVENVNTVASTFKKGESTFLYNNGGTAVAYATDETVFVYIDGSKVTRFVGKNNAPDMTTAGVSMSMALRTVGTTDYIEYVVINTAPKATMSTNYVYITSGVVGYSKDVNNNNVYFYDVIKDGVATRIAADSSTLGLGVYLYSVNMDLFTSEEPNKVESGEYTMQRPSSGVITDFQIDVISSNNVIVDEKDYGVANDNMDVLLGDARVIDLTVVPYDTEATLSVTDTVVIVYSETGGLKIAKDIYIVDSYDALTVSDIESAVAPVVVDKNTFVDASAEADDTLTLTQNLTVDAGAILYVDGNLNVGAHTLTVNGTLIVSGNLTVGAAATMAGNVVVKGTLAASADITGAGTLTVKTVTDGDIVYLDGITGGIVFTATPNATIMGELEALTVEDFKVTFSESATSVAANEWYTTAGVSNVPGPGAAGTAIGATSTIPAGTYVYETNNVYTDGSGTQGSAFLKQ